MPISVAIVGSGPAGFYTADAILKAFDSVTIDILDRLPTPFGLIRFGVAPDHQSTKRVARAYEKTALTKQVCYYGNVEVGRDVGIAELREIYDAVIVAIGAPYDRDLGVPGEDKKGVYGSAEFVGWYNGHPDFQDLDPDLDSPNVAVIGNGNVAIDVARVLVKTPEEMARTDIPDYAAQVIQAAPITDVYMFGRRGPVEAKFTNVELREMGQLQNAHPVVDPAALPDGVTGEWSDRDRRVREKNLETLRGFTELEPAGKAKRVHFAFNASPVEILGGETVEGIRMEHTRVEGGRAVGTGDCFEIETRLVIAAIGYRAQPIEGVPYDEGQGIIPSDDGRVKPGLYVVGWIKRGPTGVIGTNKPDGDVAARQIAEDVGEGGKPGRSALEQLLDERSVRWVSFEDWKRIEDEEIRTAEHGAPRRKLVTIADMLAVLSR